MRSRLIQAVSRCPNAGGANRQLPAANPFETSSFLIHLYQSVLHFYIAMLFDMEDRRTCGMPATVVWLGLAYESGILGVAVRQLSQHCDN
jgi:hypothetical protein